MAMWLDTDSGHVVYVDEGGYQVPEVFSLSFLYVVAGSPGPHRGMEFVGDSCWSDTIVRWWAGFQGTVLIWNPSFVSLGDKGITVYGI